MRVSIVNRHNLEWYGVNTPWQPQGVSAYFLCCDQKISDTKNIQSTTSIQPVFLAVHSMLEDGLEIGQQDTR
jgi:hypothetical protein